MGEQEQIHDLWTKTAKRTGHGNLDDVIREAEAEIAQWHFKPGKEDGLGSNYSIIPSDKWAANKQIDDIKDRVMHFMLHSWYAGDEYVQQKVGEAKYRVGIHNTQVVFNGQLNFQFKNFNFFHLVGFL